MRRYPYVRIRNFPYFAYIAFFSHGADDRMRRRRKPGLTSLLLHRPSSLKIRTESLVSAGSPLGAFSVAQERANATTEITTWGTVALPSTSVLSTALIRSRQRIPRPTERLPPYQTRKKRTSSLFVVFRCAGFRSSRVMEPLLVDGDGDWGLKPGRRRWNNGLGSEGWVSERLGDEYMGLDGSGGRRRGGMRR